MTPLVTLPHLLLVIAAAFLVGVRAHRETQPKGAAVDEGNEDTAQLLRLAKTLGIGLAVLTILVILRLDLGFVHTAKVIQ